MSDSPDDPDVGSGEASDDLPLADDAIDATDGVDEATSELSEPLTDDEMTDGSQVDEATGEVTPEPTAESLEASVDAEPVVSAEPAPPKVISIWPIWAWTMVGVLLVVIGLAVGAGVLSKTLLLDVISFWPAFVFIALVFAALIPRLRKGAPRLSAVIPMGRASLDCG